MSNAQDVSLSGAAGGSDFGKICLADFGLKHVFSKLGGGFKYFLFSPLFGEDFQFD